MKQIIKYSFFVLVFLGMFSCDMLEPIDENRLSEEYISSDPETAEGILLNGYKGLIGSTVFSETATDDAVHNQLSNGYKRIATGELTSQYNAASRWGKYEDVLYMNKFLDIVNTGTVQWNRNEQINALFAERMKGEAYALRALFHFYILQAHAGEGTSGQLLGIPYITDFIKSDGDFNLPRLSFKASVDSILADFDEALALLPTDYTDDDSKIDARYSDIDPDVYKVANGAQYNLRLSGRIVKALKARVALFAASPSFLNGDGYYDMAADIASIELNSIGGVAGLDPNGLEFYKNDGNLTTADLLWRNSVSATSSALEEKYFPPSKNGQGQINPSQNLVDAFPMRTGYPITETDDYDSQNPYALRDPRLTKFIIVNGSTFAGGKIYTGADGGIDGVGSVLELSTTTGYYLKKLLRPDVRLNDDGTKTAKKHVTAYFRYTELFLILAEASNEIGGPNHAVNGITAMDIIAAIRKRAGLNQPDNYLASITTKEDMREMIRNERRLELCFEGHRFWDMRRWGLDLTEPAKGMYHNGSDYELLPSVEVRNYPDHAVYMPIPNSEVLKFSALEQNMGW